MKVLRVHNRYRELGGEDVAERAEGELLRRAGCAVVEYTRESREIDAWGPLRRAALAVRPIRAGDALRDLRALVARERPDVAHFTNLFPLISPAAYGACREAGVPVVQSLHNFRLLCPAATFLREGEICRECVDFSLARSVVHRCYRGSRAASAALAAGLAWHRRRGTWQHGVDAFVALTQFARERFAEGGLPAGRIFVKPNFVAPDPGARDEPGDFALFAGRLSPEKGLHTLLSAWQRLDAPIPLWIAGDGPLRSELEGAAARSRRAPVRFLGALPRSELLRTLKRARFLVFPSECYEGFPLVLAEAFACAVPVLAARLGAAAEIVEDGRTGLHFAPRDPADLAGVADRAWALGRPLEDLGRAGRREYEERYTQERNAALLLEIYRRAGARPTGS